VNATVESWGQQELAEKIDERPIKVRGKMKRWLDDPFVLLGLSVDARYRFVCLAEEGEAVAVYGRCETRLDGFRAEKWQESAAIEVG